MGSVKDRSDGAMMPLPERHETVPNPNAKNQGADGYPAYWSKTTAS